MKFTVLGVPIENSTRRDAIELIERTIACPQERPVSLYIVNAHTLNLAASDPTYRDVLAAADHVYADGTGVRWAARLQGVRVLENMVGTDFVPLMFRETADHGHSYFLLGSDAATIEIAAEYARREFPGWRQAGYHDGYLADPCVAAKTIEQINAARPDVLLVGMGNPLQERWIHENRSRIHVPICMGIGGLFHYWAGNVSRAPKWLRKLGHEWIWRLYQEPMLKARRYLIGNPVFLYRVLRERMGCH